MGICLDCSRAYANKCIWIASTGTILPVGCKADYVPPRRGLQETWDIKKCPNLLPDGIEDNGMFERLKKATNINEEDTDDMFVALALSGKTDLEIAEAMKISRYKLDGLRKKKGLPPAVQIRKIIGALE